MLFAIGKLFRKAKRPPEVDGALADMGDEDLMLRYAAGDVAAFEILLGRHERGVLNFIYRSVRNRDRAEEMTQDVFLKVVRYAPKYEPKAKFTTWLYTLARNLCIDEARKRKRGAPLSLDATVGDADEGGATFKDRLVDTKARGGSASLDREAFLDRLEEGLASLPDEQREVFVMRQIDGLRFTEIAEITGVTDNTVKSRMRYAMKALRLYVADFEDASFDEEEQDEIRGDRDAPEAL